MALIVENGTGSDANANTYTDVNSLRTYASLRGVDLSSLTDTECEVLLIKAMDFLESKRDKFKGVKSNANQPLQWPRSDVWIDGELLGLTEIPRELEYCQLALAIEAKDHDLLANRLVTDKGRLTSEKIAGVIERTYDNTGPVKSVSAFAKADALLAPLIKRNGLSLIRK